MHNTCLTIESAGILGRRTSINKDERYSNNYVDLSVHNRMSRVIDNSRNANPYIGCPFSLASWVGWSDKDAPRC